MFNNWVNGPELAYLLRRTVSDGEFRRRFFSKLRPESDARIRATWAHTADAAGGWWDIPAIQRRWNLMITGDANVDRFDYVARWHLREGGGLQGLSIGCGTGGNEVRWGRTGRFRRIDAFDLSPERIRAARESVEGTPEESVVHFEIADLRRRDLPDGAYDMVLFEHSLHHFAPLRPLLEQVSRTLRRGGLLVVNEFVGPSRFQWTNDQLAGVNDLLRRFPREFRTCSGGGYEKERELRPSKLRMWVSDPSEAVESSRILPAIGSVFDIEEVRGYGGAILHPLFSGIAHHFVQPNATAERLLDAAFSTEDRMLAGGEIGHDFAFMVARNRR